MRFGRIPVSRAESTILAHAVRAGATLLKKGRIISRADVALLGQANVDFVVVAQPEPGDIQEDEAASVVANALAGPNVRLSEPFTGRVNLLALEAGVATYDREALIALNGIDEGLTVATLPPFARVSAGQMVATVKVIPFALPASVIRGAETLLRERRLEVAVHAFARKRIGLVLTQLEQTKPNVLAKREQVMRNRIVALGSELEETVTVPHDYDAVTEAISALDKRSLDLILLFGASAISDMADVIPLSLLEAGGEVVHLGMPVDPGNLLMLGRAASGACVIGVPSCATSPKVNGFDWVLERICAGIEVDSAQIAAMAPGGLLMEIESRPQPRAGAGTGYARAEPRIAAVVLAAGRSTRMAPYNKLLEEIAGKPVVRHAVETALASRARPIVVVTGHAPEGIAGALAGLDVRIVHNPDYAEGISTSLVAGLDALGPDADGVLVMLGDMPALEPRQLDQLIAAFSPKEGRSVCVPVANGRRGNPVLWSAAHFPAMRLVKGDTGARHLIGELADEVVEVQIDSDAVHADVDTLEELERLRQERLPSSRA